MSKQLSPGPSSGRPLPSKSPPPKPPTPQPPTTAIEPTTTAADDAASEEEDDEFLPSGWDATSTASTSLTPSIHHHAFENGRRYHAYKYGRYPIPNDDLEQSREDMKHAMSLEVTDGRLFLAPIPPSPKKIIDIGTGTGIWAVEMGDLFPGAEILGLDLSPIQPLWIPPNVKFVIDDVEDEWANGGEWDFAHFRNMALVLRDLQRVVDQTFQNLKPGGYIEFQEMHGVPLCDDGTMSPTEDVLPQFWKLCVDAMGRFGMDLNVVDKVGEYLSRAGFTNITCVQKKVPVGTWPRVRTQRLIGLYVREMAEDSLSALSKAFANLGISETEREVWGAKVRETLRDNRIHRYYYYYFWYAQKPE